jgi:hypothetical protein
MQKISNLLFAKIALGYILKIFWATMPDVIMNAGICARTETTND